MLCWLYSWPQCFEVCTLHYSKAVQKPSKSQMIPLFMAIARSYVKVPAGRMRCAEEPWHWVSKPFDIIQHLSFNVFSALKIGLSPISIAFKTCVFSPKKKHRNFQPSLTTACHAIWEGDDTFYFADPWKLRIFLRYGCFFSCHLFRVQKVELGRWI